MRTIDADSLLTQINDNYDIDEDVPVGYVTGLINEAITIEPEPHWIPCSERLPEDDGEYLVLYYTRSQYKPYMYDVISFANDLYRIDEYDFCHKKGQMGWFYCDREYGFCEDNSVVAWMPLPKPYKEESEE